MNDDARQIESTFRERLGAIAQDDVYALWLAPVTVDSLEDGVLALAVPAELRAWISDHYMHLLLEAAKGAFGDVAVTLGDGGAPVASDPQDQPSRRPEPGLNPKQTFSQFVIGPENRFAHAAALAVAETPGQAYNPLFIYGPPGVGKTHLLHAVGNYLAEFGSGVSVRYTTAETFTNDFVSAIQTGSADTFKDRYRAIDVLLIDDIQFLESKAKTEEEFFHTFNELHSSGRQLIVSCDRPPADLARLQERLRERFAAGLLVDMAAPDRSTRMLVLRKRIQHDGIQLADEDALRVIADAVPGSLRELEGALIRVTAYASLQAQPITAALAREVLQRLYRAPVDPGGVTIERIQAVVAEEFGTTTDELVSPARTAKVTWARQVAMYLAREHTDETLPAIGRQFGGRDHSTVVHAHKRASQKMGQDLVTYRLVEDLAAQIRAVGGDRNS